MTDPKEPTLTCSEVVERLPQPCGRHFDCGDCYEYTEYWQKLAEWRERRVQELEEALEACMGVIWTEFHCGDSQIGSPGSDEEIAYKTAQKLLANSEQIRKGAKHE